MRKLASIQRILDVQPIDGADAIEKAQVGGWWVVIKKGEFNVGDLIVYFEVDSWIPTPLAPFLSKGQEPREFNGVKGERLRTVKLRGQVSQGLILPVNILDEKTRSGDIINFFDEGDDVSAVLGIQKYEPPVPACLSGVVKGAWPSAIPKTDQERIQNLTKELAEYNDYVFEVTEKLEGSSCTMALIDDEFIVCSRNMNLKETEDNTFWKMARYYTVETVMRWAGLNGFAIQGEVIGEGVQGNWYGLKKQQFFVFDIFDIHRGKYVEPDRRRQMVDELNLLNVPFIGTFPLSALSTGFGMTKTEALLQYADGQSIINSNKLREGVVFKRVDGQEHFKAVSNKYLLKSDN